MSIYQKIAEWGQKVLPKSTVFKYAFNLSPMYRRTTARILDIAEDLSKIRIRVPISYKNRNYVNSIFGGSMFAAVDPIPMIQLINLLGDDYVVWDRSAEIVFKRPAREDLYAEFVCSAAEIEAIKERVAAEHEIDILKITQLTNEAGNKVYCEVHKTIYVADKAFYKQKRTRKAREKAEQAG